jgi:hypothetical protein
VTPQVEDHSALMPANCAVTRVHDRPLDVLTFRKDQEGQRREDAEREGN